MVCEALSINLLYIDSAVPTGLEEEYRSFDPGLLASTLFAFAIDVPDWGGEGFSYVGVGLDNRVPDGVRGADGGLAALFGCCAAQETNDIALVGVEELAGTRWSAHRCWIRLEQAKVGVRSLRPRDLDLLQLLGVVALIRDAH